MPSIWSEFVWYCGHKDSKLSIKNIKPNKVQLILTLKMHLAHFALCSRHEWLMGVGKSKFLADLNRWKSWKKNNPYRISCRSKNTCLQVSGCRRLFPYKRNTEAHRNLMNLTTLKNLENLLLLRYPSIRRKTRGDKSCSGHFPHNLSHRRWGDYQGRDSSQ